MFSKRVVQVAASRALAVLVAACLAVAGLPLAAFADEESGTQTAEGEVSCGNGWVLAYTATCEDGSTWEASITGPADSSAGSGQLSIPASIALDDGSTATVTELGSAAFKACEELTSVELPDTLVTIGEGAFRQSGLTSVELPDTLVIIGKDAFRQTSLTTISIPVSVAYIPARCFWKCEALVSVEFEGEVLDHLGYGAFQNCYALEELYIPALRGSEYYSVRYTESATTIGEARVGLNCFDNCTSLSLIVFLAGGEGTYLKEGGNQFGDNAADLKIVNYTKNSQSRGYGNTGGTAYFAIKYYASEEAYEADEYGTQAAYTEVVVSGTGILTALYDADSLGSSLYTTEGTLPTLGTDMVWGVAEGALSTSSSTISDVIEVYPISRYNLDYGWVTSEKIAAAAGVGNLDTPTNEEMFALGSDGTIDLSEVAVYAADGSVIDVSYYELTYLYVETSGNVGTYTYTYTQVDPTDTWIEGTYQVYADGAEGTAAEGTSTGEEASESPTGKSGVTFYVGTYTANVLNYISSERSLLMGTVGLLSNESISGAPAFVAVACADSWQNCLIAVGLAAVGGGQAVFVEGVDEDGEDLTADRVYSVVSGSGTGKVYVVGEISDVATERLETVMEAKNGSISAFPYDDADDAAALSLSVYENLQRVADENDYAWGTTAVVASSTQQLASSSIAAYAYAGACPVILTEEDGTLSDEALADLAGTDDYGNALFERVVVAGPEGYVPAETVQAIEALGLEVERVADEGSAYESSVKVSELVGADYADDALIVASATDASTLYVAEQLSVSTGTPLVAASSSADVKAALQRASETSGNATSAVYLVGDFTAIDAALEAAGSSGSYALFTSLWGDVESTELAAGDTIEHAGVLYEVTGEASVSFAGYAESALEVLEWGAFEHDGVTYDPGQLTASVTAGNTTLRRVSAELASIPAGMFAGCTALEEVGIAATSIGASAFAGCTALASFSTAATSIGASAFSGCTALASVGLTATGLKSVPASCFEGCTKLASVSIASTALASVGAKAFSGCKKLGSITLKSGKLTSIGASAFAGCSAMTKATLSSKNLKSIGASAFSGCTKLASVSIASTALTSVGAKAFSGCKALKSVSLKSAKLASIGASAFAGCSAMTKATLSSKKLKTIGASAFSGCSKLASVSIASTALTKVGAKAFYGCKKLKSLTLKSKKLKTIGASAFQGCSAMTKLTLGSTALTKVGAKALYGCKKLKALTLKTKKLKSVGKNALKGTTKKLTVKVPKAKVKKYTKLLQKRGLKKKAKVKAA